MKKCAIIGHRKIIVTNDLKEKIKDTLIKLITIENVNVFIFGSKSMFDNVCYEIVSELKNQFPNIYREQIRAEYPVISEEYDNYLKRFYENSYYYDKTLKTGKLSYIKRNEIMINKSDFCLFYCNQNYLPKKQTASGTILAFNYATSKNKHIINLFDDNTF